MGESSKTLFVGLDVRMIDRRSYGLPLRRWLESYASCRTY
jgi:hypothetical protein